MEYDFYPIWWGETISEFAHKAIPIVQEKYKDEHIESIINSGLSTISVFF